MISVSLGGSFKNTEAFLKSMSKLDFRAMLERYGQAGVAALASATPKDTGRAATSWGFEVVQKGSSYILYWTNSDMENGFPVAIMLQYGHGTGTGGYVQGRDYINPALRPVMDMIVAEGWKVVTSA
jgi:hypothetical protein